MKRKFIDIRTTGADSNICDPLCVNHASMEQLMAVLQLAESGSEILVMIREEEFVQTPLNPSAVKA